MKKLVLLSLIIGCVCSMVFGQTQKIKKADGRGYTEAEARNDALSNLSFYFYSNVKNAIDTSKSFVTENNKTVANATLEKRTMVSSEMPLFGVTFEFTSNGKEGQKKEITAVASMDPKVSLPLYEVELNKTSKTIESKLAELKKLSGTRKEQAYAALDVEYAQYTKLVLITQLLGGVDIPTLSLSPEDFNTQFAAFSREVTSLEKAAKMVVSDLPKGASKIYVYAPQYEGDGAGTQFSRTLAQMIQGTLGPKCALENFNCTYYLQGSYYLVPGKNQKDDMVLSYFLCKNDGTIVSSSTLIKLPFELYDQYTWLPAGYSLTKEIANGNVVDPAFTAALRINGDRKPQFFKQKDSLIIEARVTEPCYVYAVGHVFNEKGEQFSYLFPLEPYGEGKEMFVRRISSGEVNRWVVLNPVIDGEVANIEIIPPFGEECLQLFAVTCNSIDDAVDLIPSYRESDDYYIVSGSPASVSKKTRGLAVKKATEKASTVVHTAETSISYATHK